MFKKEMIINSSGLMSHTMSVMSTGYQQKLQSSFKQKAWSFLWVYIWINISDNTCHDFRIIKKRPNDKVFQFYPNLLILSEKYPLFQICFKSILVFYTICERKSFVRFLPKFQFCLLFIFVSLYAGSPFFFGKR